MSSRDKTRLTQHWLATGFLLFVRPPKSIATTPPRLLTYFRLQPHTNLAFPSRNPNLADIFIRPICAARRICCLHKGTEAAIEFQKLLDRLGLLANCPLGALAHLGLARAFVMQ